MQKSCGMHGVSVAKFDLKVIVSTKDPIAGVFCVK
jgi:hypothetical protein